MTKLSKIQYRCLKVAHYSGGLRHCENGDWVPRGIHSGAGKWSATAEQRAEGVVFRGNTVRSLERMGLLEPSIYEIDILGLEPHKASRLTSFKFDVILADVERERLSVGLRNADHASS